VVRPNCTPKSAFTGSKSRRLDFEGRNIVESMVVMGSTPARWLCLLTVLLAGWRGTLGAAQVASTGQEQSTAAQTPEPERPLPDVAWLMRQVETNQRTSEALLKDYLYHQVETQEKTDGHGGIKKTESREYDIFWLNGVQVRKLLKKDGKELKADEQKKENERIDKDVAKAKERRAKADAEGKETDSYGHEKVTVSRLLTLGSFTNPRRISLDGRDTIAVDYVGDPKAKTQNRMEEVIRDLAGTVWIDEQDHTIAKIEGHFLNAFKIGGGMLVNIKQGTNFNFEQRKVNGEVWLPARGEGEGSVRALLFISFNGKVRVVDSDYRKFKATATILPGVSTVEQPDSTAPPQ
jgi:hypothetical protein